MRHVATLHKMAIQGRDLRDWYAVAGREIRQICDAEGWCPKEFAHILALTSPRVQVRRNVRIALGLCGLGNGQKGSLSMVRAAVQEYRTAGRMSGQKCIAFASALQGNKQAIVLDKWMSAALGVSQKRLRTDCPVGLATIKRCENQVRKVAKLARMTPVECQSSLWAAALRQAGRKAEYMPLLEEYEGLKG